MEGEINLCYLFSLVVEWNYYIVSNLYPNLSNKLSYNMRHLYLQALLLILNILSYFIIRHLYN